MRFRNLNSLPFATCHHIFLYLRVTFTEQFRQLLNLAPIPEQNMACNGVNAGGFAHVLRGVYGAWQMAEKLFHILTGAWSRTLQICFSLSYIFCCFPGCWATINIRRRTCWWKGLLIDRLQMSFHNFIWLDKSTNVVCIAILATIHMIESIYTCLVFLRVRVYSGCTHTPNVACENSIWSIYLFLPYLLISPSECKKPYNDEPGRFLDTLSQKSSRLWGLQFRVTRQISSVQKLTRSNPVFAFQHPAHTVLYFGTSNRPFRVTAM